jgi:hypothetical protein
VTWDSPFVVSARGCALLLFVIVFGTYASAYAQETTPGSTAHKNDGAHLGVQTCSSSTCHGAVQPWQNSSVLQNEFVTWSQHDAHAKAYKTLLSKKSKQIARKLGVGDAHKSTVCLQCHSDDVPTELQAKFFRVEDGVGCEACHGGAENWLGIHVAGTGSHADNIAAGMSPTDDPHFRAQLCQSCHSGMGSKMMPHRLLGAGHPRLVFELDTYMVNQPAHFRVDDDYRVRKIQSSPVRNWALGQLTGADSMLASLANPERRSAGMLPEFAFFDCHACHHPMNSTGREDVSHPTEPGMPRLNDASLIMLTILAQALDPALSKEITATIHQTHKASFGTIDGIESAVQRLRKAIQSLHSKVEETKFTSARTTKLLEILIASGISGQYIDFVEAEQATMAAATFLAALEENRQLTGEQLNHAKSGLAKLYAVTQDENVFKPTDFKAAVAGLQNVMK